MKKRNLYIILISAALAALTSCGIYSFVGTSIAEDVKTVNINYIENRALKVNPSLSNTITEALNDKFRKFTRLSLVTMDGDLEISGEITGYDIRSMGVTADEVASKNRLTITVKIYYINNKHPEESFEEGKSFSGYEDYDSNYTLDQVEAQLVETIVEKIVEDIFNATVANW